MVDNLEPRADVDGDQVDDVDPAAFPVDELPLPGINDELPSNASALERAAHRTLAHLHRERLLDDGHAVQMQLLLDLCRGYSSSVQAARGKVTVAASAVAAQIQNLLAELPSPTVTPEGDGFDQLADELRAATQQTLAEMRAAEALRRET